MPADTTFMAFLINVFSKNSGAIARFLAGLIASAVTALAVKWFGYTLTAEENLKLMGLVTSGVTWAIGEWTTFLQNRNIKELQTAMQAIDPSVKADGHVGAVTVAAVERAADALQAVTNPGSANPPQTP